jgi:hypothetical protein
LFRTEQLVLLLEPLLLVLVQVLQQELGLVQVLQQELEQLLQVLVELNQQLL